MAMGGGEEMVREREREGDGDSPGESKAAPSHRSDNMLISRQVSKARRAGGEGWRGERSRGMLTSQFC